jgi:hypothetical protein
MKSEIKINNEFLYLEINLTRLHKEQSCPSINQNEIKDIEAIVELLEKLNEEK